MRFRKNLFTILAILSLAWIIYGFSATGRAVNETAQSAQGQSSSAFQAGAAIGGGIGITFFLCSGGLPFVVFALLAWRNGVGLTNKKRHEETIAAIKQQNQ